ncbi:MAG: hypothetical protein OXC93_04035 [Rhodospirillaceae bacterium]|nr:hypothetical protein [Rhodospirillaceae bacterium]
MRLFLLFGVAVLGACSTVFSTKEQDHCEKALKVLIDTSQTRDRWSVDKKAQASREINGRRVNDVTLTYIQNNTRKLFSCYYRPGTTMAVGYIFEGQRLTNEDTAAVNRRI